MVAAIRRSHALQVAISLLRLALFEALVGHADGPAEEVLFIRGAALLDMSGASIIVVNAPRTQNT
jgi:hypothetical protein